MPIIPKITQPLQENKTQHKNEPQKILSTAEECPVEKLLYFICESKNYDIPSQSLGPNKYVCCFQQDDP